MSYFATEWTLLPWSTDCRAATAPGLSQDLRVLSQASQSHRQFVWISRAHMRAGPHLWSRRARLDFLQWEKSTWVDRAAGFSRSTVWTQRTGWLADNYANFLNSELIYMLDHENCVNNCVMHHNIVKLHANKNIFRVPVLCFETSLLLTVNYFIWRYL